MSLKGKTQLTFVIVAPPDQVEEGDRLFRNHVPWMEATHHRDGDKALLSYTVTKSPELSNPSDPGSEPTGNTIFTLIEIYETEAGVADHFEQAEASWEDFAALGEWMEKCTVTGTAIAPIINALW